jgi:hypothetical protein
LSAPRFRKLERLVRELLGGTTLEVHNFIAGVSQRGLVDAQADVRASQHGVEYLPDRSLIIHGYSIGSFGADDESSRYPRGVQAVYCGRPSGRSVFLDKANRELRSDIWPRAKSQKLSSGRNRIARFVTVKRFSK